MYFASRQGIKKWTMFSSEKEKQQKQSSNKDLSQVKKEKGRQIHVVSKEEELKNKIQIHLVKVEPTRLRLNPSLFSVNLKNCVGFQRNQCL